VGGKKPPNWGLFFWPKGPPPPPPSPGPPISPPTKGVGFPSLVGGAKAFENGENRPPPPPTAWEPAKRPDPPLVCFRARKPRFFLDLAAAISHRPLEEDRWHLEALPQESLAATNHFHAREMRPCGKPCAPSGHGAPAAASFGRRRGGTSAGGGGGTPRASGKKAFRCLFYARPHRALSSPPEWPIPPGGAQPIATTSMISSSAVPALAADILRAKRRCQARHP